MKNFKTVLGIVILAAASFFIIAADHIDAPAVQGGNSDITDFYAFQGQNTSNLVFVANLQGLFQEMAKCISSVRYHHLKRVLTVLFKLQLLLEV